MGELEKIYTKEADKFIKQINSSLSKLKKNPRDKNAINNLERGSHTLKGNSLQIGYYSVAYLAKSLDEVAKKIIAGEIALDNDILAFLFDITSSVEKSLAYEKKDKRYKINPNLFEKLDKLLRI